MSGVDWPSSWIVFDTETTGFGSNARILEIGVVYFEEGQPVDEWSTLLNPPDLDWNHPKVLDALKINGLSKDLCTGAPTFADIKTTLDSWLSEPVWVAHNLAYDTQMIWQEIARLDPTRSITLEPALFGICTLQLSSKLQPGVKGHKLQDVAQRWGVVQEGAHRAVADAMTCGKVLQKMLEKELLPRDNASMGVLQKEASAEYLRRRR